MFLTVRTAVRWKGTDKRLQRTTAAFVISRKGKSEGLLDAAVSTSRHLLLFRKPLRQAVLTVTSYAAFMLIGNIFEIQQSST